MIGLLWWSMARLHWVSDQIGASCSCSSSLLLVISLPSLMVVSEWTNICLTSNLPSFSQLCVPGKAELRERRWVSIRKSSTGTHLDHGEQPLQSDHLCLEMLHQLQPVHQDWCHWLTCWNQQSHAQPHCHRINEITNAHMLHVRYIPHICSTLYKYITHSAYFTFIHIPVSGSL